MASRSITGRLVGSRVPVEPKAEEPAAERRPDRPGDGPHEAGAGPGDERAQRRANQGAEATERQNGGSFYVSIVGNRHVRIAEIRRRLSPRRYSR